MVLILQVNNNGMVSFESGVGAFFATPFPLNDTQGLIAVYWTDVDTRLNESGTVWYRETTDAALLRRFHDDISGAFPTQRIFSPISLFITTWDHVGYYLYQFDRVIALLIIYSYLYRTSHAVYNHKATCIYSYICMLFLCRPIPFNV